MAEQNRRGNQRKQGWRSLLIEMILLMGFWTILSGLFDVFHLGIGLLSAFAVVLFNRRINRIRFFDGDEPEWESLRFEFLIPFLSWLVYEIIVGSLQVAWVVLHPRMPVAPSILRFKVKLPRLGARVMLGNVITLTPGTITLDIRGDEFVVHTLTRDSPGSIIDGTMPGKIAELFDHEEEDIITGIHVTRSVEDL